MRKTLLLTYVSTALTFIGCMNDATEDLFVTCPVEGGETVVIGADIEQMTRTSLVDPDGDGIAQVVWSDGDAIGVVTSDGNIRKATLTSGAGTVSAEFAIADAVEGETYTHAFYPYIYNGDKTINTAVSGTKLSLNLPAYQTYAADGIFSTSTNTMVAESVDGRLTFRSIMGCIEIKLAGSQTVRGITVKNSVKKVSGKATFDLETKTLTAGTNNESFSYAYLECPEKVQLSSTPTSFHVLVPAGEYDCLQIGVLTDDGSYVRSATVSHTVKTATILPLNCGNLDTMIDTSSAVDLSAAGYANCYIVSPDGGEQVYSFETKFVDGTPVENPYVGGVDKSLAYCQLVWAEESGIAYDIRFDKEAGKVYFKYDGSTLGNARIAACNDFFASANNGNTKTARESIMWGWHIWATEAPSTGIVVDGNAVKDIDGDGTITTDEVARATKIGMMDRNLGATWVPKSIAEIENMTLEQAKASTGCFYQFGNTHPYPRQKEFGQKASGWAFSAVKYRYGFSQYNQDWATSTSAKNNAMVNAMYPMYRYGVKWTPSVTGSNNVAETYQKQDQWLAADIIGGNSTKDEASKELCLWGGQGSKTNYDPCPAGWVVPHRGNIYQMTMGAVKTINGESINANRPYYHLGRKFSDTLIAGSYVSYDGVTFDWMPFSGYMGGGSIGNSGITGYFWGCGYYGTSYGATSTQLQYNMASYARVLNNPNAVGYLQNGAADTWCALGTGYQIRCVKRN